MATLNVNNPTLLDLAKRTDPDGSIAQVVELLNETNEILDDVSFVEGNLPTGHKTTVRTGLPAPTWRKLYGGVQPTKSRTAQVTDTCGMLEAYAEVDKALADLNSNTAEWRLSEERPFIEGINQEFVDTLFYGNEALEPEAFTGFMPRFNALTGASNSENVLDGGSAGGQADNASIMLVVWSPQTCHCIIPKGSKAGLQMTDKGQVTIENVDGNDGRMEAYRTHYRMDAGLTVKDWRYVVRIANIDRSTLTANASAGADLPNLMFTALDRIPNLAMGRPVFYMDRNILTTLRQQLSAKVSGSTLTYADVGGRRTASFQDIPIRRCDALAADEARLS